MQDVFTCKKVSLDVSWLPRRRSWHCPSDCFAGCMSVLPEHVTLAVECFWSPWHVGMDVEQCSAWLVPVVNVQEPAASTWFSVISLLNVLS